MTGESFVVASSRGQLAGVMSGVGESLLLLHGGPGLNDYLESLEAELAPSFRTIRYQQRGLEPSTTEGPFTVEQHVADVVTVMDELGLERVWLVGHSWGGYLALQVAVSRPERIGGVVSIDPLGVVGDGGVQAMSKALDARLLPENRARFEAIKADRNLPDDPLAGFRCIWPGYFAEPASAPPFPADFRSSRKCSQATWESIRRHFDENTLANSLPGLPVPVWLVLGKQSPIPVDGGREAAALIPNAHVVELGRCGHFPWLELPGSVLDVVGRAVAAGAQPA